MTDLVVSKRFDDWRWSALVEVKDGSKPPSNRKLTPDEQKFHDEWQGEIYVIASEEEIEYLEASLQMRRQSRV